MISNWESIFVDSITYASPEIYVGLEVSHVK